MNIAASFTLASLEGRVEGCSGDRLTGWAWFPSAPDRPVLIDVVAGDRVLAATTASLYRPEAEHAQKRDGFCGFEILISKHFPLGTPLAIRAHAEEGVKELRGSPVSLVRTPSARDSDVVFEANHPENLAPARLVDGMDTIGFVEQVNADLLAGWVSWPNDFSHIANLTFYENGRPAFTTVANRWRNDLAEMRQGDGRCGFEVRIPEELHDGRIHEFDIYVDDATSSALTRPIYLRLEERPRPSAVAFPPAVEHAGSGQETKQSRWAGAKTQFSIIVNFYNMKREAERTLASLTRGYQLDIGDMPYEVLCIDNGSNPPLEKEWVESFGPEFRLIKPSVLLPSPCAAINEAARQAKGRYVAVMIDGAHVLTPGIFREAIAAFDADPDCVVAARHWFVGGDQRWLSSVGYTREREDALFARIGWPADGYGLFEISAPLLESPNYWFGGLSESNCLFIPGHVYERIGGIDEAFSEPGAGFANLDLMRRAADAASAVICLVGEATMHQYHGGMTTNVTDQEKEIRVRAYSAAYSDLRGGAFENVPPQQIKLRGSIRSQYALVARQRPLFPGNLGITEHIRPGYVPQHFDEDAQIYLQSAYAECGAYKSTNWLGQPIDLAPSDLTSIQDIIREQRPTRIVATGVEDGLVSYMCSVLDALDLRETKIVRMTGTSASTPANSRIEIIVGDPYASVTLAAIDRAIGAEETTLVLFGPQPTDYVPVAQLSAYAQFVSHGSYLIYLRTAHGQPWLGYSKYWHLAVINRFVNGAGPFVIDQTRTQHFITSCPSGFLKKAKDILRLEDYDDTLDHL